MASGNTRIRGRLFKAQNGLCYYCGFDMNLGIPSSHNMAAATVDHVKPKSEFNTLHKNAVAACARCNTLKDSLSVESFFALYGEAIKAAPYKAPRRNGDAAMYADHLFPLPSHRPRKMARPLLEKYEGATSSLGDFFPKAKSVTEAE